MKNLTGMEEILSQLQSLKGELNASIFKSIEEKKKTLEKVCKAVSTIEQKSEGTIYEKILRQYIKDLLGLDDSNPKFKFRPSTIFITGGNGGIGAGLAKSYAVEKTTKTLILTGRNEKKLEKTKKELLKLNGKLIIITKNLNVRNKEAMLNFINETDKKYPIDMVVANAGIGFAQASNSKTKFKSEFVHCQEAILETNMVGVLNTILPVLDIFKTNKRQGQVVLISSSAAYLPVRYGTYGASKTFVKNYGKFLRRVLAKESIYVNVVTPDCIDTDISIPYKKMGMVFPDELELDDCIERMRKGLDENRGVVAMPMWQSVDNIIKGSIPVKSQFKEGDFHV